jgi:hypothetical protein
MIFSARPKKQSRMNNQNRRDFVKRTTFFSFGLAAAPLARRVRAAESPGNKLLVGMMGLAAAWATSSRSEDF